MKECYDVQVYGKCDTAGNPVYKRICFCGTTACLKSNTKCTLGNETAYHIKKSDDCDCEYEYTLKDGNRCKKCQDKFYSSVLRSSLL